MASPKNQAAWLHEAGAPLKVEDAPMPIAGPGEIVVKNAAVAVNPLDWHMLDSGVFVQQWPAVFGSDVAGEVYQVGQDVQRFKKGDRVIGQAINLVTGRPRDAAFARYTVVVADKAAILPDSISFTDGAVIPLALCSAICALSATNTREIMPQIMPGVKSPALGLPYPVVDGTTPALDKTLIIYGGSSSVGSMATQVAAAAGVHVITIAGKANHDLSKRCGAAEVFDYKDADVVDKVVAATQAAGQRQFVGVFDAISTPQTYPHSLSILSRLGGGHLACVHPPPQEVPANVEAGMIFAVDDITNIVWKDFVTLALESGALKCLPPPTVVGKGLELIQQALAKSKAGVSATKLVVEL